MPTQSILINYIGYPGVIRGLVPDNGLANLAASLIREGHKTKILDYATVDIIERLSPHKYEDRLQSLVKRITKSLKENLTPDDSDLKAFYDLNTKINMFQKEKTEEIAREISSFLREYKADFVGFKLWEGDGFEGSLIIAEELKRINPKLPLFAGGPHVDWFRERIFGVTDVFDSLVYGDGEETITLLADYVQGKRKLEEIPNLIYKENGRVAVNPIKRVENLNSLPSPIYDEDVYLAMKDNQKIKMAIIDESRGCPYSCNFCIHPLKSGKKWRLKEPQRIIEEMKEMSDKYDIKAFKFAGSNPPLSLKREIAEEIIKRGVDVEYTSFAHAKGISLEDFKLMKKSGCYSLFFGVESGDQEILDKSINKRIKVGEIKKALKTGKEAGLHIVASVIIPAPGETEKSKQETLNLLLETNPGFVDVNLPFIVEGTAWAKESGKYGIDIPNPEKYFAEAMKYRVKTFCPPDLWDPFPYFTLDGKSFKDLTKENSEFIRLLERNGMLTQVTSETVLLAKYADMPPREFRDRSRNYLFKGDYQGIENLVEKINQNIQKIRNNLCS